MRKIITAISGALCLFSWLAPVSAQTIRGNIYSEFYSYQTKLPERQNYVRSLQGVRLDIRDALVPGLSFYVRGRMASDILSKLGTDPDFRVFGAYLQYSTKGDEFTVKAGRQYTYEGIGGFTMDGAKARFNYRKQFSLTLFGGMTPGPTFYTYDEIGKWDQSNAYGARVQFKGMKRIKVNFSYLQRNFNEETDSQLAGVDFQYRKDRLSTAGRLDYDIIFRRVKLVSLRPRYAFSSGHSVGLEYRYSHPTFNLNNFFSVVEAEPYSQFRLTPSIKLSDNMYGTVLFAYTIFDSGKDLNMRLGGSYKAQSAGIVFSDGHAGNKFGVYANLRARIMDKAEVFANIDMYSYKLDSDEADSETAFSSSIGARYELLQNLGLRSDIQYLTNAFYSSDVRFYGRIEYDLYSRQNGGGGNK